MSIISTPITEYFGIKHPILLAGMNIAAGPELAAAVSNEGGLGVIGGYGYTPEQLRQQIKETKEKLVDPNLPFGVDLLIPQVGGTARKTNYDYTKGQLDTLLDIIISSSASLFVCAVGVPPPHAVAKLHAAHIPVMNIVGHPKHVQKALDVGCDLICAQAGEGGGHTGSIPASILVPACVDAVKGRTSPLTGKPIYVIGAGAVYDGRSLVANLMWGAQGVWVGTRFVASLEAGAPPRHKDLIVQAGFEDTITTRIYSGRPVRVWKSSYVQDWEENRQEEIEELTSQGIIPFLWEVEKHPEKYAPGYPWLMGRVSALIHDVLPAKVIIQNMIQEAADVLSRGGSLVRVHNTKPKL